MRIHGKSWKVVAEKLVEMGGRERTPGNVKDKFKQMGEDSAPKRDLGPWTLSQGIALFENVCKATGIKAMKKSITLSVIDQVHAKGKRYEIDEAAGEVRVYDEAKVQLKEVLPHLIKHKRAYRKFCRTPTQISWKAI